MKEEVENKHGHLIFPFIHMKNNCFDKLHFQRHMCNIRVPKRTCDRTRLAELKFSWIASGTVCTSLWAVINGDWSKWFISELPLSSPQWESELPGETRMSFLLEAGMVSFFWKLGAKPSSSWEVTRQPLCFRWSAGLTSACFSAHGTEEMRGKLSLCYVLLLTALWVSHFPLQSWSWKCHVHRRLICWGPSSCVWKAVTFLASNTESGLGHFVICFGGRMKVQCLRLWGRKGAKPLALP